MRIRSIVKLFVVVFINLALAGAALAQGPVSVNERLAASAVESLHAAEATYASLGLNTYGSLPQLANAGYIDPVLATGEKYGYSFTVTVVLWSPKHGASFTVSAVPLRYGKSGRRSFYIDPSGVLRGADRQGAPATAQDPIISLCYGNEELAIRSMRTVGSAEFTYFSTSGGNLNFGSLRNLFNTGLIDKFLASGAKCGYLFKIINIGAVPATGTPASFKGLAVPMQYPATGVRSFYIDENGVLRGADHGGAPANANDPPIQN